MENPYSPPAASYGQYLSPQDAWSRYGGFVPLKTRMVWASVAIMLSVASSVILAIAQTVLAGQVTGNGENVGAALILLACAALSFLCRCLAALAFCLWIHRAASNVHARGGAMSFTPGWCVGWFFIPFAHLVKPYRAVMELWFASNPESPRHKGIVDVWWATWLIMGFIETATSRINDLSVAGTIGLGGSLFGLVAAVFCVQVMSEISQRQLDGTATKPVGRDGASANG
ncbi:DUF4328 domain-containing protein [Pendulispora rubella]|uniref:DUF4328 domain-containing protein n=1 Tax=Pendulispora rubella TaxID=2741070 RepID=A0ABZ2L9E8_9BACT